MSDPRPELSAILKRLPDGPRWYTWPNPRCRLLLGPVSEDADFYGGKDAIVVNRGRFGLGVVCERDGLFVVEPQWLTGGPTPVTARVKPRDIRALVLERHDR